MLMADYRLKIIRKNNRHMYLRVTGADEVTVSCNYRTGDDEIRRFLLSKDAWIRKRLHEKQKEESAEDIDGKTMRMFGKEILIRTVLSNVESVDVRDGVMTVLSPSDCVNDHCELITKHLNEIFLNYLESAIDKCRIRAVKCGIEDDFNVRVKLLKSRYGSYSARTRTVCLNLYLVKYPEEVIESVIYHEMAHMKHMNHQRGFYSLLYRLDPDYDRHNRMLKADRMIIGTAWFLN